LEAKIDNPGNGFRHLPIDGQVLKKLVEASLIWLRTNQQIVNSLNVFPVPDGDTGTNMVLTMQSAYDEIASLSEQNIGEMVHSIAHGALMGARGNSGVILSQLWRGFARALDSQETIDASSLVAALAMGRDTAYKGVVRPVEGTILTVAKDIALAAEAALESTDDPYEILESVVSAADRSVQRTPELLPVLKDAGVVDAGGKGLFFLFEGMLRHTQGLPLDNITLAVQPISALQIDSALEKIEPGQDVEWVIDFRPTESLNLANFYSKLEGMGTSIQVGEGDGIYRMHIHVPNHKFYEPLQYTSSIGTITKAAMENLVEQFPNNQQKCGGNGDVSIEPMVPDQIAVVSVVSGIGLARIFASLGAAAIVEGGQTMNPSTQQILLACENLPTNKIILLPNNKNIFLAAKAAAKQSKKQVAVVPTRSIPQGIAAMVRLVPTGNLKAVAKDMTKALAEIQSGEITRATRSAEINKVRVEEGQIIALLDDRLVVAASSLEEACLGLLKAAHANDYELITLFYGEGVTSGMVAEVEKQVRLAYSALEIEIKEGCQPHYMFFVSIE
jgi:hypothetical protein